MELTFYFLANLQATVLELLAVGWVFFFIEKIRPADKKARFFSNDFFKELGLAVMNGSIFTPLFTLGVSFVLLVLLKNYLPYQIFDEYLVRLPMVLQMFAGAFIMDFATYWRHRFTHRYMWPYHSVHHSAEHLNWLTALRMHPVDILASALFDITFLHILGFSGAGIAFAAILMNFYNFFAHANLDLEFGRPMRYIFASPKFHRWHHATDRKAYDKNFCSMFSCLDLMFGTYYYPEGLPKNYGLSPAEQKEVPRRLGPHLVHPFKKHFQSFRRKR